MAPINDRICIELIQNTYDNVGQWDKILETDYVHVRIKEYDDCVVIVFPGSYTFMDWSRDFQADMRFDPDLGQVEWGFQQGLREVYGAINPAQYSKRVIVTGHSLGAARALLFGALMQVNGLVVGDIVTFGSPRPGGSKLAKILEPVAIRSYRNGDDEVCGVPFYIPWFRPYQHPRKLIEVYQVPLPNDSWGPFRFHHSQLYLAAMEKMFP